MKSSKLLKMGVLALALGSLAACGNEPEPEPVEHECVADTAAGWQTNGTKHWYKCTDPDCKKQVKAENHAFGAETVTKEATCVEAGSKEATCSVCAYKKTTSIAALGHEYAKDEEGNDVVTWTSRADCTNPGAGTKGCTRKGCTEVTDVTEEALGHTYAQDEEGNDIVTWTKVANCTEGGEGSKKCTREGCTEVTPVTVAALGHDIKLIGDDTPAEEGKAKVRLYSCSRECGITYFGFKATEVGPNSGRLVDVETTDDEGNVIEIGKRFWGRPIGNNMELGEDGSATEAPADLTAVYDSTVQGDLFEYVFDISAEQLATIGDECLLYCDAKPADYLGGQDFWACDPSAEEWTRGMYIEGENAGQPINTYRYILYVDDAPVAFDADMKAPVTATSSGGSGGGADCARGEFVMPYKFHLHVGENKISLRMAGGYRSVFYNFTFRPVEAEEEDPTPEHEHVFVDNACECGATRVAINSLADATNTPNNKSGTPEGYLKLGSNGNTAEYSFNATAAGKAHLVVEGIIDSWSGNKSKTMYSGNTKNPTDAGNIEFNVNGTAMNLSAFQNIAYSDLFPASVSTEEGGLGSSYSGVGLVDIGEIDVVAGANTLVVKRIDSYNILISHIYIVFEA